MADLTQDNAPGNIESVPPGRAKLKGLEGGGETSPPDRSWYRPDGDKKSSSQKELADREESPEQTGPASGSSSAKNSGVKRRGFIRGPLNSRKKRVAITGVVLAATIAATVAIFLALLPLKILHIMNNLQSHFFATSENAVSNESEVLLSNYITTRVLPGLSGSCSSTKVDRSCAKIGPTTNPVSKLYNSWKDANLENKLYSKHGIEFAREGNKYYLRAPGIENRVDITKFKNRNGNMFAELNNTQFRQFTRQALNSETRWSRVFYYFKVGPLIDRKYGVRRCVAAKPCGLLDKAVTSASDKKLLVKAWTAERILAPRNEMLSLAVQCALSDSCHNDVLNNNQEGINGEKQSKFEKDLQSKLDAFAVKYGVSQMEDLLKLSKEIQTDGFSKYVTKKVLTSIIGDDAAKYASNAVPVVGWLNLVSNLTNGATTLGPALKKMNYVINSSSMVAMFAMYRTYADEIKSGDISASVTGGFTNTLGPGAKNDGSGSTAEGAPLYGNILGGQKSSAIAFTNGLFPRAYAASPSDYLCDNGKPPPAGKLICPEESLGHDSGAIGILNNLSSFMHTPLMEPVTKFATLWGSTIGKIINGAGGLLGSIVGKIVGYLVPNSLKTAFADAVKPLIGALTSQIINSPISDDMSGGRTFDMIAGGADSVGNDMAHNMLGGVKLSSQQTAAILNDQDNQKLQQYKSQSFFARMFDTNSNYSPVTKLAMAMPSSTNGLYTTISSWLTNPLGRLFGGFASIFSGVPAFAANVPQADPFGITQYGYPNNDANLATANKDPEAYWNANCTTDGLTIDQTKQVNADYRTHVTINEDTQMPENTTSSSGTDPCYLIQAAVGSAGALYDSSLLTADDRAGSTGISSSPPPVTVNPPTNNVYQDPFHGCSVNAERIDQGVDYAGTCAVYAIGNGTIVNTVGSGWPNGVFISYTLSDGPAAGKTVFVAEDCTPSVSVGQHVGTNTVICNMFNGSSGIEIGWAQGSGDLAMAHSVYNEGDVTAFGVNFSQLLESLGAPPGTGDTSNPVGTLPSGWPVW